MGCHAAAEVQRDAQSLDLTPAEQVTVVHSAAADLLGDVFVALRDVPDYELLGAAFPLVDSLLLALLEQQRSAELTRALTVPSPN